MRGVLVPGHSLWPWEWELVPGHSRPFLAIPDPRVAKVTPAANPGAPEAIYIPDLGFLVISQIQGSVDTLKKNMVIYRDAF